MTSLFITFEGLDGSGKSYHLGRVVERLEAAGTPFCFTHEPGGTPLSESIRSLFLDPRWGELDGRVELLMVFASRCDHLRRVIDPALAAGRHVLCDRFTDSTIAYQGYGRGVALESIAAVDQIATGSRVPDRTLLFDLPPETARKRGHSASRRGRKPTDGGIDRLDREQLDFYGRVREGYLALAQQDPDRFRVIDSSQERSVTAVAVERALADLAGFGPSASDAPLSLDGKPVGSGTRVDG